LYSRVISLKNQNPSLKVLLAVGGWNLGSAPFSRIVHDATLRRNFVQTSVEYLKRYGFDGLDLDWEYPGNRDGQATDKQLFTTLIRV
jgi:chitinase